MENQYQKWVNGAYLAAAALIGYLLYQVGAQVSGVYDLESRIRNIDLMMRVGSVLISLGIFGVFYSNRASNQFMSEVADELGRVTWPTQRDTSVSTFVVLMMVLGSGLVLGFMDYLWTLVMKWIL